MSDAIYNGSAAMTLYYYMYRSWQDCCRRGENRSWPSVSVESVDSEYWCSNNAIVYAFIMRLTVEERVLRPTFKLNTLYKADLRLIFKRLINHLYHILCAIYVSSHSISVTDETVKIAQWTLLKQNEHCMVIRSYNGQISCSTSLDRRMEAIKCNSSYY